MKKILIILFSFIIIGCTNNNLEIKGNITEIKYNDTSILKEEFNNIKKLINISYTEKSKKKLNNKLTIKTTDDIYYFTISDKYLEYNNMQEKNTKLNTYLHTLTQKYTDKSFYTIDYMKNYDANNDEGTILLDKTSNYIIINLGKKVRNLKINEIEEENNNFKDINLVYSKKNVKDDKIIIRKSINYNMPDIRISFETQYNYLVSIIPTYNLEKEQAEFKTTFEAK